jgi:hypothetical protein
LGALRIGTSDVIFSKTAGISIGGAILAAALSTAAPASAATYDAVGDFSIASNPNGVWAYGTGVAGTSFTAMTVNGTSLLGSNSFDYWQGDNPVDFVPLVGKNVGADPFIFSTVLVPTGVLEVHPGQGTDTIVQFIAPTAGKYTLSTNFELLDDSPTGVIAEVYDNGTQLFSDTLTGPGANESTETPGQSTAFSDTLSLKAGDTLSFAVNNDGNFLDDSTGLTATISSAVPEPASWALMLVGFGGLGVAMRARRTKRAATA